MYLTHCGAPWHIYRKPSVPTFRLEGGAMSDAGLTRWAQPSVILVATDLSDLDRLVPFALQFAHESDARIVLLHVLGAGAGIAADGPDPHRGATTLRNPSRSSATGHDGSDRANSSPASGWRWSRCC